jgi:hypothetical protein
MTLNDVQNLVASIIEHQQTLMGHLAIDQARKVSGLNINDAHGLQIEISNPDFREVLSQLVKKYEELFGEISIEACKEAVKESRTAIPKQDLPDILV